VRITRVILCYALGWASASPQIAPATVPWRAKSADPGRLLGVVVRPASQLSVALVEEIGRAALEEGRECDLVHVEIYSEEDYPPPHYMTLSHAGYDWWWFNFQSVTQHPVGRVTALGRNAVAEFRDTHGTVSRKVLAGSDPLSIETANGHFRLLHISFHPSPLAREKGWLVEYPFQEKQTPPTKDEFVRSPTLLCGGPAAGPYDCHVLHGH